MVVQIKNRLWWWKEDDMVEAVARYLECEEQWDSCDIDYMKSKPWKFDDEWSRYTAWLDDLPF